MWIYRYIYIFCKSWVSHISVETVMEDPGYDHEGPCDVCGYVLGVKLGEDVTQGDVDAKHKDVIQKECHLLWKKACPGAVYPPPPCPPPY